MSTDSLSSSHPLTRYFDLLPLELIRHIIEELAPLEYTQETYQDRKRTLYSTCLICRLFRKLAQPLLFETINVADPEHMAILNLSGSVDYKRLMSYTRNIAFLDLACMMADSDDHGLEFLDSIPNLEDLRMTAGRLATLKLVDLKKLHLHQVELGGNFNMFLPQLEVLSLSDTYLDHKALSPGEVPALRHFAIVDGYNDFTAEEEQTLVGLGPQLSSMTCLLKMILELPLAVISQSSLSTLFDCHLANPDLFRRHTDDVSSLRIYHSTFLGPIVESDCSLEEQWRSWTVSLESKQTVLPLQLLYLPRCLIPTDEDLEPEEMESLLTSVSHTVDSLVSACRRRHIEVVFEHQPSSRDVTQISKDFTRRSAARRRALEAGNKEGNA